MTDEHRKSAESSAADVPLLTNPRNNSSLHGLTESGESKALEAKERGEVGGVASPNHVSSSDSISYTRGESNLSVSPVKKLRPFFQKQNVSVRLSSPNIAGLGRAPPLRREAGAQTAKEKKVALSLQTTSEAKTHRSAGPANFQRGEYFLKFEVFLHTFRSLETSDFCPADPRCARTGRCTAGSTPVSFFFS